MSGEVSLHIRKRLVDELHVPDRAAQGPGPIRTLLEVKEFDEVHLVSNFPRWATRAFSRWLGRESVVHGVILEDPTDYKDVYNATDQVLASITKDRTKDVELSILLTPGTPAMAAIFVLLGKSRYPAAFFQTSKGRVSKTEIPFDVVVDFVPELLRKPDAAFYRLSTAATDDTNAFDSLVGESPAIRLAIARAQKAAIRDVPVLIHSESGTGKEHIARAIRAASGRRNGQFTLVNCAALSEQLLESELFGHVKGAFTDASQSRKGAFESTDGGILFLDEVGDCSPRMQAKLLRAL